MPTDIRVTDINFKTEEFRYRTPIKFGGVAVDRALILNTQVVVRTTDGRSVQGAGSMPLGNVWAFPSKQLGYTDTLRAMVGLAVKIARLTVCYPEAAHPIDINHALVRQQHQ